MEDLEPIDDSLNIMAGDLDRPFYQVCQHGQRAATCDFQQCGILTCVDSARPMQTLNNHKNSILKRLAKALIRLRVCTGCLSLCWLHISHCWKRERSGSVVECLTRDRRAAGSSLTGVTALWSLSKTHLS